MKKFKKSGAILILILLVVGIAPLVVGAIISGIAALAGAGISAASNASNKKSQEKANQQNINFQKEVNEQQQQNQLETWQREDTAMQRKSQDLAAAGLSPHLAAGGQGSPVSAPIKMEAPKTEAFHSDVSGVANQLSVLGQLGQMSANIEKTQADTEATRMQTKIANEDFNFMPNKQKAVLLNIDKTTNELINMKHDLEYAKAHNLPVGSSGDVWTKRLDYLIEKLKDFGLNLGGNSRVGTNSELPNLLLQNPMFKSQKQVWDEQAKPESFWRFDFSH